MSSLFVAPARRGASERLFVQVGIQLFGSLAARSLEAGGGLDKRGEGSVDA
jgi:hypothetical protein